MDDYIKTNNKNVVDAGYYEDLLIHVNSAWKSHYI